jgi:hypothetical protein
MIFQGSTTPSRPTGWRIYLTSESKKVVQLLILNNTFHKQSLAPKILTTPYLKNCFHMAQTNILQ